MAEVVLFHQGLTLGLVAFADELLLWRVLDFLSAR
jgi:hypothetical protein